MTGGNEIETEGNGIWQLCRRSHGAHPASAAPAETVKGSFFKQGAGGKGFNQGVAAHKAGGDVAMITKLGRDSMANVALDVMTELNMPKDFLFYNDDVATGIAHHGR